MSPPDLGSRFRGRGVSAAPARAGFGRAVSSAQGRVTGVQERVRPPLAVLGPADGQNFAPPHRQARGGSLRVRGRARPSFEEERGRAERREA